MINGFNLGTMNKNVILLPRRENIYNNFKRNKPNYPNYIEMKGG
jgi:hypothetical protein